MTRSCAPVVSISAIFSLTRFSTTDKRQVQRRADRRQQLAGRLLLAAFDLRQVAETDPGGLGHLTQRLALGHPLLAQRLTDELAQQHRPHRDFGSHDGNCTQPPPDNTRSHHAHGLRPNAVTASPRQCPEPRRAARRAARRGRRADRHADPRTATAPAPGAARTAGWATATNTSPTGWPSCGSGPATPVVASPSRPDSAGTLPWAISAAVVLGHRPDSAERRGLDTGQRRPSAGWHS